MSDPVANIADLPLDVWEQGTAFAGADVRIGPLVGVTDLGISYSEVPPGKSGCPFHNHHVDVCEYPDSGKFLVSSRSTRNPYDPSTIRHVDRLGNGLDYWDGEPGAEGKDQ